MSNPQTRRLISTALAGAALILSAGAFAADAGCYTVANGVQKCRAPSERTREAVKSELRNAQASGQLQRAGELTEAPVADPVPQAVARSRSDVKAELAQARASHTLPRAGEI